MAWFAFELALIANIFAEVSTNTRFGIRHNRNVSASFRWHLEARATVKRQQHAVFQVSACLLSHLTLPWRQKFSTGHSNVCRSEQDTGKHRQQNSEKQESEAHAFSTQGECQKVLITSNTDKRKKLKQWKQTSTFFHFASVRDCESEESFSAA